MQGATDKEHLLIAPRTRQERMQTEYYKWWSPNVGYDMELKVYGSEGKPVIVFPVQGGRFFDYENFKMVEAISSSIEAGKVRLFTVDSLDRQTWTNDSLHPADRALRHEEYDRYIIQEVAPFMRQKCAGASEKFMTTGCGMGAYHAANFFFRHPDVFDSVIALSGLYQLKRFVGNYMDDTIFFNSPLDYLAGMTDPWYLDQYCQSKIIACCGRGDWEEAALADILALSQILNEKGIPAWIDIWGQDVTHDWPWWQRMMPYFLSRIGL